MRYIDRCWNEYNERFPEDWEKSRFNRDPNNEVVVFEELLSFSISCVDNLSRSILSGEYVENTDEVKEKLKSFLPHLNPSYSITEFESSLNVIKQVEQFYRSFSKCINRYLDLIYLFENKYENASISSVFASSKEISNKDMFGAFRFFVERVQPLCKFDYTLSFKESLIDELFLIRQSMIEKEGCEFFKEDLKDALLDKASFLLLKLHHVRNRPSVFYYDSRRYEIKTINLKRDNLSIWETYFQVLHKDDDRVTYMNENLESLERKLEDHTITIPELIILMKHYQKTNDRTKDIEKIIEYYDNHIKFSTSIPLIPYNKFFLRILKSYLHNSRLSYQLSHNECSLSELNKIYNEVKEEQSSIKINNFHPYEKLLEYLSEHFLSKIDSVSSKDYAEALALYEKCLKLYSESIEWGLNNDFYPFILPFSDSMVSYPNGFKVFYPSSFTRPLRYEKLRTDLSDIVRSYDMFKTQRFLIDERKSIVDVKKEVEKAKGESVKILGIFSTVVTFLFGTIDVFSKTKDFKETLLTSLGVGVVLYFFCTLLYLLLLSEKDYEEHPIKYYSILFVSLIGALVLAAYLGSIKM